MEFCAAGMKKTSPELDLQHQALWESRTSRMGIVGKIGRNLAVMQRAFRNEGILAGCECAFRQAGTVAFGMSPVGHPRINLLLYRITDVIYDRLNHVDTGGMVNLPEMEGKGRNYVGTPPRAWKLMMNHIPISPPEFTYLDFGWQGEDIAAGGRGRLSPNHRRRYCSRFARRSEAQFRIEERH